MEQVTAWCVGGECVVLGGGVFLGGAGHSEGRSSGRGGWAAAIGGN